jgi:predicted lipid-binding transport protein (Tim44 family)
MQGLLTPDLYSQHVAQLEAMKSRHEINTLDGMELLDCQLILVSNMHDEHKDSFTAWMRASAQDRIVDDRTGNVIRGDEGTGVFEEFWTFRRDGGSWELERIDQPEEGMDAIMKENFDSISTPEMLQRQYEKAGGPKIKDLGVAATRERDESAAPESMGAIKEKSGKVHRLLNFLADHDKMWDEDKLVSFTRSAFIALNVALETKNLDSVQASMKPDLYGKYSQMVEDLRSKGERIERRNLAVRDVEIVLVKNYYDNRKDSFTAWVSGQAQTAVTDEKSGKMVQGDDHVADFEEFWTFQRDGDQWKLSDVEKAYSSSSVVDEENVDEGSDKSLMDFYYSKDRAV